MFVLVNKQGHYYTPLGDTTRDIQKAAWYKRKVKLEGLSGYRFKKIRVVLEDV